MESKGSADRFGQIILEIGDKIMQTVIVGNISTDLTYTPAGTRADGTKFSSNVSFNVAINHKGKNKSTDFIKLTCWGSYGDMVARSFEKGDWICAETVRDPNYVYQKRNAAGISLTDNDGKPVMATIESYQVSTIHFPPESYKHVVKTIQRGLRKPGWDVPGSQEESDWQAVMTKQRAEVYTPGSEKFGFALVKGVAQTGIARTTNVIPQDDEEAAILAAHRAKKAAEKAVLTSVPTAIISSFEPPAVSADEEVF